MPLKYVRHIKNATTGDLMLLRYLNHKPEPGYSIYDAKHWLENTIKDNTYRHANSCHCYYVVQPDVNNVYIVKRHVVTDKEKKVAGYTYVNE